MLNIIHNQKNSEMLHFLVGKLLSISILNFWGRDSHLADSVNLRLTYAPEKLRRQGFQDISMDIKDREKIKVSAET